MLKNLIFFFIFLINLSNCSAPTQKKSKYNPQNDRYSHETEDAFSEIEEGDNLDDLNLGPTHNPNRQNNQDAASRYQKMRQQSWDQYLKSREIDLDGGPTEREYRERQKRAEKKYRPYRPQVIRPRPKPKPRPQLSPEKIRELEIQAQQHMSYYCMKNRNQPQFRHNEKKCQDYTGKVLNGCKKRSSGLWSKQALKCVVKKLRF